jgi:hypothetical protein
LSTNILILLLLILTVVDGYADLVNQYSAAFMLQHPNINATEINTWVNFKQRHNSSTFCKSSIAASDRMEWDVDALLL